MKIRSNILSIWTSAIFACLSVPHCMSSSICPRENCGSGASGGVFGCYRHYADFTGGFVGGVVPVEDRKSCIVLTADSLFIEYYADSIRVQKRFSVSWEQDFFGKPVAKITLAYDSITTIRWQNDSLSIGARMDPTMAEGGYSALYARIK